MLLALRACLFAVTEKVIGSGMVRAFVLARSTVIEVGIVASAVLVLILLWLRVVENGIDTASRRNEYLIRSRVVEKGIFA